MSQKQIQLEIFELGQKIKKGIRANRNSPPNSTESKFPTQSCIKVASSIIIIIMSFALGVEHGKSISQKQISSRFLVDSKKQTITNEINLGDNKIPLTPIVSKELEKKESNDKIIACEYIIQVATYKKNSSYVKKETTKLQQKGYNTLIITKGNFMEVCTGKFANKKIAKKYLKKLRQTYKDCFIRKI